MSSPPRCRICLAPPTAPFCPPCRHAFCYECITTSLRVRPTCPTCSAPCVAGDLVPAPPAPPDATSARTPGIAARTPDIAAAGLPMRPPPLPRRMYDAPRPSPRTAPGGTSVFRGGLPDSPGTRSAKRRALALARTEVEMARVQREDKDSNHSNDELGGEVSENARTGDLGGAAGARVEGTDAFRTPDIGTSAPARAPPAPAPAPAYSGMPGAVGAVGAAGAGAAAGVASSPSPEAASVAVRGYSRAGLGIGGPLAAVDNMSAEQLQLYIASLTQKLHAKEFSQRISTSYLLHDFLTRTRAEKQAAIDLLSRHVGRLDSDISATETRLSRQNPSAEASGSASAATTIGDYDVIPRLSTSDGRVLDERRRSLSTHFQPLEARYFADDDDGPGVNATGTSGGQGTGGMERGRRTSPPIASHNAALARLTDDISKVTQFNQFRYRATLMHTTRFTEAPGADVFRASNIVSSIEFDRESEYVATAGVTKLIKIFEFSNIMRNLADVHFPVKEIQANAKLSWVAWNPYIRHHLASSDYEGVVTLWDAQQGVAIVDYEEHEKRAWSVDFCGSNPTLLASGSDDGRVKLWSTNEPDSVLTIDNHANVCSVKFNPVRGEMLAFGSAHHHVHYYDLRNTRAPVQVFKSHQKTVSYVKFTSEHEMVSACADSSIKLWNLKTMELERTFTGHRNDRHFVGLSVTPDYIACGSETNSIYTYYKALPSPVVSYCFPGQDPLTGEDVAQDDEDALFVSSVCWCPRHPSLLVAANSLGSIKVLALEDSNKIAAVAAATAITEGKTLSGAGHSSS